MGVFLFWLILAVCVGAWASSRGHSGFGMFLVSVLLSPVIGFIIEAIRSPNNSTIEARQVETGTMKKCPACAELVRAEAIKCRYCGEALPAAQPPATPVGPFAPPPLGSRQCSACGNYNSGGGTHCGVCGEALGVTAVRRDDPRLG